MPLGLYFGNGYEAIYQKIGPTDVIYIFDIELNYSEKWDGIRLSFKAEINPSYRWYIYEP